MTPIVAAWTGFTNDGIEYPARMFLPGSIDLVVERLAEVCGLHLIVLREPFIDHWQGQTPQPNARLHYTIGAVARSDSMFAPDASMVLAIIKGEQGKLAEAKAHLVEVLWEPYSLRGTAGRMHVSIFAVR